MRRLILSVGLVAALVAGSSAPVIAEHRIECQRFEDIASLLRAQGRTLGDEGFEEIAEWFETLNKAEKACAD